MLPTPPRLDDEVPRQPHKESEPEASDPIPAHPPRSARLRQPYRLLVFTLMAGGLLTGVYSFAMAFLQLFRPELFPGRGSGFSDYFWLYVQQSILTFMLVAALAAGADHLARTVRRSNRENRDALVNVLRHMTFNSQSPVTVPSGSGQASEKEYRNFPTLELEARKQESR